MRESRPTKGNLYGLSVEEMAALDVLAKEPPFRARQLARWIYGGGAKDIEAMTDVSKEMRQRLGEDWEIRRALPVEETTAGDESATKLLFRLEDGARAEAVWIRDPRRETLCISSQAGCAYGCTFCATASLKAGRNLSTGEILSQVACLRERMARALPQAALSGEPGCRAEGPGGDKSGGRRADPRSDKPGARPAVPHGDNSCCRPAVPVGDRSGGRRAGPRSDKAGGPPAVPRNDTNGARPVDVHNIVFMGMGEPLANYAEVVGALKILCSDLGFGIAARRITVSTVGLEPEIRRLAHEPIGVRLAFSLNATTDEVRSSLMPVNRKYPFRTIFEALREYQERKKARVTLEYVLLSGINDTPADAKRLAGFARSLQCKVNLIAYNPHPYASYVPLDNRGIEAFRRAMLPIAPRVTITVRWSKGREIQAACGQLATRA